MMYTVVCAVFLGFTSAQILPNDEKLSDYGCSSVQTAPCVGLQSAPGTSLGLASLGLGSSSFVCSDTMGFCSLSCSDATACDTLNLLGAGMEKSTCTSGVCSVDLSCTTSDDCATKISALPTCESNICVAKQPTSTPTDPPSVPNVTPTTPVTPAPSTTVTIESCAVQCSGDADDAKFCEVDGADFGNLYELPCTETRNGCEAKCLIQTGKDEAIVDNPTFATYIETSIDVNAMYSNYCAKTTCDATTAPPTTKPPTAATTTRDPAVTPAPSTTMTPAPSTPTTPVTPAPSITVTIESCAVLCSAEDDDAKFCEVDAAETNSLYVLPCTETRNECEAKCLIQTGKDEAIADNPTFASQIEYAINVNDMYIGYCAKKTCDATTAPPTTKPPTAETTTSNPDATPAPTTTTTTPIGDYCAGGCETEAEDYQYCAVNLGAIFSMPCVRARNECEAKCMITAGLEDAGASGYMTVDEAFTNYCALDSCAGSTSTTRDPDTTQSDTTTLDPDATPAPTTTTTTPDCDDDDSYLRFDCPDDSGDGCSIQVELTLDVCLLNFKFGRMDMYSLIKQPFVDVIEAELSGYEGFCTESEVSIEAYAVAFADNAAMIRGRKDPPTNGGDDCEDATAVCGDARDEFGVTVSVSVGLYCGECATMKAIYAGLVGLLDEGTFDVSYVDTCLGLSVDSDSVCVDGFGGVQIASARMVMTDADGVEIPNTEVNSSGASVRSLVMVAVVMMVSMW